MKIIAGISVMLLAGCVASAPVQSVQKPKPRFVATAYLVDVEQSYIDASLQKVREVLVDPDSAQFFDLYTTHFTPGQPKAAVCGYVDAKDRLGSFVGKTRFMASTDFALIWEQNSQSVFGDNYVIRTSCELKGGEKFVDD